MTLIESIRQKEYLDEFEFTKHAVDRSILRRIAVSEIREAIRNGEVIEIYSQENMAQVICYSE